MVAANRDEFHRRPSTPAAFWPDQPQIFAGRDLEKGGTWLGVTRAGRFAALTNFRDPPARKAAPQSRGLLVSGFLAAGDSPEQYLRRIAPTAADYDDFNLLVADRAALWYFGSRDGPPRELAPGVYAVSNHILDRRLFAAALAPGRVDAARLLDLLGDTSPPPDDALPQTGIGVEWERLLGPIFIASESYGTRASTALSIDDAGRIEFAERSFGAHGRLLGETSQQIEPAIMPA